MSNKTTSRMKAPPSNAVDTMSPRKKAAVIKPETANKTNAEDPSYEDILQEKNFMYSLLQQAKAEREQFIETIKEKDRLLKEKETKLTKLAHRTMAEEQAFRETLAEVRTQFDVRLMQRDTKLRQRDLLICDLLEVVTTAELFTPKASGVVDLIVRSVQSVPVSKYTVEAICRNQLLDLARQSDDGGDQDSTFKRARQKKINDLVAVINAVPPEKRPRSKKKGRKKRSKSPKRNNPSPPSETPALGASTGTISAISRDESETEQSLTYSVSASEDESRIDNGEADIDLEVVPPPTDLHEELSTHSIGAATSVHSNASSSKRTYRVGNEYSQTNSVNKITPVPPSGPRTPSESIVSLSAISKEESDLVNSLVYSVTESGVGSGIGSVDRYVNIGASEDPSVSIVFGEPSGSIGENVAMNRSADITLSSFSESAVSSETGGGANRVAPGAGKNGLGVPHQPHQQGAYIAMSSEDGPLAASRSKARPNPHTRESDSKLPYWWSSLTKPTN